MAYPTDLTTFTHMSSAGTLESEDHNARHDDLIDSQESVEAKVGVDGSSVVTSHDYKLSGVTGTDKALSTADGAVGTDNIADDAVATAGIQDDAVTSAKIETQEAWVAPTLLNSWVNYGGTYATAGYMKDSLGFVHLKGMVKTGTIGQVIFTLPVSYRPAEINTFPIVSYALFGDVYIATNGGVTANVGSSNWVSLSGIIFKAEQ